MKIALAGLPGAGKTSVGLALAAKLGTTFTDLDAAVAREAGSHPAHLIDRAGEAAFRAIERSTLEAAAHRDGVLSLGGGTLDDPANARRLRDWRIIWLDPSLTTLVRRLADASSRPLLRGNVAKRLDDIEIRRRPIFTRTAEARFAGNEAPEAVATEIALYVDQVERLAPGLFWGQGSRHRMGAFRFGRAGAVMAASVASAWGEDITRALPGAATCILDDAEERKTLAGVSELYSWGSAVRLDRTSDVFAIGGGVTTDLVGFFAATYLRGLPLIDVPTTLLAAVDAAIGAKVGVDLPEGKNLVGAFHPARATVVDPDFWGTEKPAFLSGAMAEIVKMALIEGEEALGQLEELPWPATPAEIAPFARRAALVKEKVVEADPREEAERTYLNLGHTVGHALEQATAYRLPHGEAIAIGLMAILRYQEAKGAMRLSGRVERLLRRFGLPTSYAIDPERLLGPMSLDKKRSDGSRRIVLLERPGRPYLTTAGADDLAELARAAGAGDPALGGA